MDPFDNNTKTSLFILVAAYLIGRWLWSRETRNALPPGPPRKPIVGNALELPPTHSWLYYTELANKYGEILSVDALGQPIIILNSFEACNDLLIKKSSIFQGRPKLTMCGELVGWDAGIALSEGPRWQLYRKLMNQFLGPKATTAYYPLVENEARALSLRMLTAKDTFLNEFRFGIAASVLDMAYGKRAQSKDDEDIAAANAAVIIFGEAAEPGKWLVDTFPILKFWPSWLPFSGFQKTAKKWRRGLLKSMAQPFDAVKAEMAAGTAKPSFTMRALEDPPPGASDEIIKWASGTLYVASVDTISSTMTTFVLNMVQNPEVQAKAQAELDRVVGQHRFPTFADRPNLPYIEAVLKESMRFHPPAPMGLPYRALEEVRYQDYVIPKNTILMGNLWSIINDPKMYPSPERFIPERFEKPGVLDPHQLVFGFGRRICPGQYLADATLWISIATVLATYTFSNPNTSEWKEATYSREYTGGMVCEPLPFNYAVSPRSDAAIALIRELSVE